MAVLRQQLTFVHELYESGGSLSLGFGVLFCALRLQERLRLCTSCASQVVVGQRVVTHAACLLHCNNRME